MAAVTTISARSSSRALAALLLAAAPVSAADEEEAVERGAYLVRAGGCVACHTDVDGGGVPLAGGGEIESPFGVFRAPNLTPHPEDGIGAWEEADFLRAMRWGVGPAGAPYYAAFPYTAYSGLTRRDLVDMWRYLRTLAPVARANERHALRFPFNLRAANLGWQFLFFAPEPWTPDPRRSDRWNRGAYLARHLLHCGECHTGRNPLGGFVAGRDYAGHREDTEGGTVPNITPHETGIGDWSESDIAWLLKTGLTPSGDAIQGTMAKLVEHGSSHLSDEDLAAVAAWVVSLPPVENRVREAAAAPAEADDEYDYDFQ